MKNVNDQAVALLEDPAFLHRAVKKILELGLVGEIRNTLIIFLACLTMFLKMKVSVLVSGPSSSGKSARIEHVLKLIPPEFVVKRASLSRKAIAYGEESLAKRILYVNEYRGGREAQLLLRVLQSEGEVSHEYAVSGKTKVTQRLGAPVVLTTTSEGQVVEDDATRFLTINVNESPNHILAVLTAAIQPQKQRREAKLEVWQQAIRILGEKAKKGFIFPEYLAYVAQQLPRDKVRAMRDWKRVLGMLQACALCRPQNLGGKCVVSFEDYCVVYQILNPALTASVYALAENELAVQKAVKQLQAEVERAITTKEVMEYLGWSQGMVYKYVRAAVKHGLIKYEGGTHEKNLKRLLPVVGAGKAFLPSPKEVLEHVDELGESVTYINPFTGNPKTITRRKAVA